MSKVFKSILNTIPRPWLISMSLWVRPLLDIYWRGHRYTDPINGKSYRRFLPYGYEHMRSNVLSPGTLSLERHRLCWLYLKEHTELFSKNLKVLHFAPEQAFYPRFRRLKNIEYTTTDLNSPLADVHADICALPFNNNQYDMIICNHVLEHIPDDLRAMSEIYRVLKPGGLAILQVPYQANRETTFQDDSITDPKQRAEIFGQYDHVRVYGMDYFDRLRSVGFRVEAFDIANELDLAQIQRYGLAPGELIPLAFKD
jgi:SAM-dependent methyltransferase